MPRLLFFVCIAFLVWLAVRVVRGRTDTAEREQRDPSPSASSATTGSEPVLQCAWCGVHVPMGQAVALPDGRPYCGAPHREAAAAADRSRA